MKKLVIPVHSTALAFLALAAVFAACTDGAGNKGPALLAVSAAPGFDGGVGSNAFDYGAVRIVVDRSFSVSNTGQRDAESITTPNPTNGFSYKGGVFPGTGGTCATTIPGRSSCTIVVEFDPTTVSGAQMSNISLNYFNGSDSVGVIQALSGVSTAQAVLKIGECASCAGNPTLNFGGPYGIKVHRLVTLSNIGAKSATGINVSSALGGGFSFTDGTFPGTGGTCPSLPASLPADTSCSVSVSFDPAGRTGPFSSAVTLGYFDGLANQSTTMGVQASATFQAALTFDYIGYPSGDFPIDLGTTGLPRDRVVNVSNQGAQPASSLAAAPLTNGSLLRLERTQEEAETARAGRGRCYPATRAG